MELLFQSATLKRWIVRLLSWQRRSAADASAVSSEPKTVQCLTHSWRSSVHW